MFIDEQFKNKQSTGSEENGPDSFINKRNIIIFLIFSVVLLFIILGVFWVARTFFSSSRDKPEPDPQKEGTMATSSRWGEDRLPETEDNPEDENGEVTTTVQAENLYFGDFYKKPSDDFEPVLESYELPFNVKNQAANYYELNREIDLEKKVEELNHNGFAIVENNFKEADDFFSSFRKLESRGVPTVITRDFLNYYYQNVLKTNFKEIEKTIFYDNLWEISLKFYKKSKRRYEELLEKKGLTNDPLLEAARKETAFFAVALKLLEPNKEQVNREKINDEKKFSIKESGEYYVEMPVYLQGDVESEVKLIEREEKRGEVKEKSPVLLYYRDYSDFNVPPAYRQNARLHNVYLTLRWFNSNFPLFYRSESCPECNLDKSDWRVNTLTAFLIAADFSREQELKNKWAQIYKVLSFFRGLRDELTYLDYHDSFYDVWGEDYSLKKEFWDKSLEEVDEKLKKIQENISSDLKYTAVEGSFPNTTSSRPLIGMRFLSDPFLPNEYIYKKLTYPEVGVCSVSYRDLSTAQRQSDIGGVRGFAFDLDIVNLIKPLGGRNQVFDINAQYKNYEMRAQEIKDQLRKFGEHTWHKNNYWSTLYALERSVNDISSSSPSYFQSDNWLNRQINLISGSLASLQVEPDKLKIYQKTSGNQGLGASENYRLISQSKKFNYIEPDLTFIKEIKANSNMLLDVLSGIEVTKQLHSAKANLSDFIKNLERIEKITKKELRGEDLSEEDHEFISEFSTHYRVEKSRDKTLEHRNALTERIEGVKLLVFVYKREDGKKVLVAGPVFNYQRYEK